MAKRSARRLVLGLALLACGCGKDADHLARIGRMTAARLDEVTGGARGRLANGWQAMRGSWGESTPDSRVRMRLHWDKALADADLRVSSPKPGVVLLEGTLPDLDQHRRAIDLARSTRGVKDVLDQIQTPGGAKADE